MTKEEFKQFVKNETGEELEDREEKSELEEETLCGQLHNNAESDCAICMAIRLNI